MSDVDTNYTIEDRIKAAEDARPVPYGDYRKLEDELAALKEENERLKARVAELEAGAYEVIMAFNATQDKGVEVHELVDASLAHMEAVRKLWNIWATRKEPANEG